MKARQHILVNVFILIIIAVISFVFGLSNYILSHILFFVYGCALFLLGAILPDSDSNDKGSYIYHKKWLNLLAYSVSWLEYPIMIVTKREKGHRESLHTYLGIAVTSLWVVIVFALIGRMLFSQWFIDYHLVGFLCLLLGQFAHLIGDIGKDWKPSLI